ncbi:MAG: hypothetical protein ACKON8_03215, partial [Planctomycetota bacterium]
MTTSDSPPDGPIPPLPRGGRMAAVHSGIKRNATREDVTLVASDLPATEDPNVGDLTARVVRGRVHVISRHDNLVKGAAGAAVQN